MHEFKPCIHYPESVNQTIAESFDEYIPKRENMKKMIIMKFFETITDKEIDEFDKRIDSKQKQGKFTPKNLRIRLTAMQYKKLRQIVAYFKKECDLNIYKSDLLYVGLMELIENNPDAEDMLETLGKHGKI